MKKLLEIGPQPDPRRDVLLKWAVQRRYSARAGPLALRCLWRPTGECWRCGQRVSREVDHHGRVVAAFKGAKDLDRWDGAPMAGRSLIGDIRWITLPMSILPEETVLTSGQANST